MSVPDSKERLVPVKINDKSLPNTLLKSIKNQVKSEVPSNYSKKLGKF